MIQREQRICLYLSGDVEQSNVGTAKGRDTSNKGTATGGDTSCLGTAPRSPSMGDPGTPPDSPYLGDPGTPPPPPRDSSDFADVFASNALSSELDLGDPGTPPEPIEPGDGTRCHAETLNGKTGG